MPFLHFSKRKITPKKILNYMILIYFLIGTVSAVYLLENG